MLFQSLLLRALVYSFSFFLLLFVFLFIYYLLFIIYCLFVISYLLCFSFFLLFCFCSFVSLSFPSFFFLLLIISIHFVEPNKALIKSLMEAVKKAAEETNDRFSSSSFIKDSLPVFNKLLKQHVLKSSDIGINNY